MTSVPEGWAETFGGKSIRRTYLMKDFAAAVRFVNGIAEVARAADHHPDLHLTNYSKLEIVLSTHSAGGVTEKDLALAAKIDRLPKELKPSDSFLSL